MQKKSENIGLEYMVELEDGLSPKVHVYGIDSEAGEFYLFIFISVTQEHSFL